MVDSGRATDPPASIPVFFALGRFAGASIPNRGARTSMAAPSLLDMSCPAANCTRRQATGRKSASRMAKRVSWIYLRDRLVSR
jgi:hypothetical protein